MIGKLAAGLARALLATAAILAVSALLLTVIAWRLLGYPYRKARPTTRGKLEAGLNAVTALAALSATLRGSGGESGAVDLAVDEVIGGGLAGAGEVEGVGVRVG